MTDAAQKRLQAQQEAREDRAFSIDDADARAAGVEQGGLALPTLGPGGPDLIEFEEAFRRASFVPPMLFTADDQDGVEVLDDGEAEKWRLRMDWPEGYVPTVEQAWQWVQYEGAVAARKEWLRRYGGGTA